MWNCEDILPRCLHHLGLDDLFPRLPSLIREKVSVEFKQFGSCSGDNKLHFLNLLGNFLACFLSSR